MSSGGAAVILRRGAGTRPLERPLSPAWFNVCVVLLAALAAASACDRARPGRAASNQGTVTLVNRVRATVRGATCADCGSRLEAVLHQHLDPATITIAPSREWVDVEFERGKSPFASASFRRGVADAGGEVISITIDACGTVDTTPQGSWLTSGSSRLLLDGPGPWATGTEICVSGDLRDEATPARLVAGRFGS